MRRPIRCSMSIFMHLSVIALLFAGEAIAQSSFFFYSFSQDPWIFNSRNDDGSIPLTIYTPPSYEINEYAADGSIGKVYYYEATSNKIIKSDYNGSNTTTVLTASSTLFGMAACGVLEDC
jgi:hypothetical protein